MNRQLLELMYQVTSLRWKLSLFAALLCTSACATQPKPELEKVSDGYKVSVKADGEEVENFRQQLVHRVSLSRAEFEALIKNWPKGLPVKTKSEYDMRGQPSGLRVVGVLSRSAPGMGLQQKDLVTAVGTKHTFKTVDLWQLFRELSKSRKATLTLVRGGRPHKILYSLQ